MSASESQRATELYEFGPFRIDPEKETLRRAGEPVSLTPKTFQILLVLARNSTEVVTKDDLLKAVWPDTFVGEANLSRNIFMLRKALGESAQNRQYILTVPGRGYRLAECVHRVQEPEVRLVAASHTTVQVQVSETKPWGWIAVAAICLLAVGAGTVRFLPHRKMVLTAKDTVVLAAFANSTGDPIFDETLRQGMVVQLEQSPFLSLISDERIQQTLRLMGRSADGRLTLELAREICERTGSAAVLEGSIASLGSQYVLGLRATNCRTGDVLDNEQAQASKKEGVLTALTLMAGKFRNRVGESIATIQQHSTPLAEATTPSLEALKAYSVGWQTLSSTGPAIAMPLFRRAAEIDPQFAMAHAMLGRVYGDLGESALSVESTSRAYELRNHADDQERFFIDASYDSVVTGNLERARQTCEAWEQTYPRDARPDLFLSGIIYPVLGRYEEAKEKAKSAIAKDPAFAIGYNLLALSDMALSRLQEADDTLREASQRNLQIPDYFGIRYQIAFLKNNRTGMDQISAADLKKSGAEDELANQEAFAQAYGGHIQEARRKSQYAADLTQQSSEPDRAALYQSGAAIREALFGEETEAIRDAASALRLSRSRDAEYGAAFALVLAGKRLQSARLAKDLEKRFPEDSAVRFNYVPTLRALRTLADGEPTQAVELLQVSRPYELGQPSSTFVGYYGALYPVYVRGQAYQAARMGSEAAGEFQKILAHPGIVVSDPIAVLAHLQLGRAFAVSGDKIKAKSAYRDFLNLWKDADPNIPILNQAKAEYAKL